MPHVEAEIYQAMKDNGFTALAVHTGDSVRNAIKTRVETGITFPMLIDFDGEVKRLYSRVGEDIVIFPLGYVRDCADTITQIYTVEEPSIPALLSAVQDAVCK